MRRTETYRLHRSATHRFLPAVLAAALLLASPCGAQTSVPASRAAEPETIAGAGSASTVSRLVPGERPAQLVFQNRLIVEFRANVLGRSPEERAAASLERIRRLLDEGDRQVTLERTPLGTLVKIGNSTVFALSRLDLDPEGRQSIEDLGRVTKERLADSIQAWEEQRNPIVVATGIGLCVLGTAIFAALIWLVWKANRWLARRFSVWLGRRVGGYVGGVSIVGKMGLRSAAAKAVGLVAVLLTLLLAYWWVFFCLRRFPYTLPLGDTLRGDLVALLGRMLGGVWGAIPGLAIATIIFLVTRSVTRIVRVFFTSLAERSQKRSSALTETAVPTARIVIILLWLFALVLAFPYLPGSNTDAFKGTTIMLGLMLSLGTTNLVNQAMSGLVLMYSRALRPGDLVRADDVEGVVVSLGVLSTKIRNSLNVEITVPNAVMVGTKVQNFTRLTEGGRGSAVFTIITLGYDVPWRQVHAMLLLAARKTPNVLEAPAPRVDQMALGEVRVTYRLEIWVISAEIRTRTLTLLHGNILDIFNEYGVSILTPAFTGEPARPAIVSRERWYAAPAEQDDPIGHAIAGSPDDRGPHGT